MKFSKLSAVLAFNFLIGLSGLHMKMAHGQTSEMKVLAELKPETKRSNESDKKYPKRSDSAKSLKEPKDAEGRSGENQSGRSVNPCTENPNLPRCNGL